jgi:hypothetical protein
LVEEVVRRIDLELLLVGVEAVEGVHSSTTDKLYQVDQLHNLVVQVVGLVIPEEMAALTIVFRVEDILVAEEEAVQVLLGVGL